MADGQTSPAVGAGWSRWTGRWSRLVIGSVMLFANRRERVLGQVVTVTTLTARVSCLLVIQFLDRPYADRSGSISPTEMSRTLELMDRAEDEATPTPPCDARGAPLAG